MLIRHVPAQYEVNGPVLSELQLAHTHCKHTTILLQGEIK